MATGFAGQPLINAGSFAAAKAGTPLPGSFMATHPAPAPAPAPKAPAPKAPGPTQPTNPNPTYTPNGNNQSSYDAYAAQQAAAKAAAQAQAETNYHNNMDATNNTINTGIGAGGSDYRQSILDAFNGAGGFKSQQGAVDNERVQNEMSRLQGMQGVRDMVGNGLQSGGIVLDNAGAGTSSAGEALARAYGIEGRQQASKVGQQSQQGKMSIDTEQNNLDNAENNFQNVDMPTKKADIINGIVSSANQALTYLNAIAASASLPDQINIAQRVAEIKAQATSALSAFDGELAGSRSSNTPMGEGQYNSKAAGLFASGTAPQHSFDFTNSVPAEFQGSGPVASDLPIFVGNKKTTAQ